MKILGKGHTGVVVADTPGAAKKFYTSKAEGLQEQEQLTFLGGLQDQGFDIGCTIPKLLEVIGEGKWEVDNKLYSFCSRIERIPGTSARWTAPTFTKQQIEILGDDLGSIAFTLHTLSKPYIEHWKNAFGHEDKLLAHLLEDKAGYVMLQTSDQSIKARVKEAADYLESRRESLVRENTLSHLDLTLSNTQVSNTGRVNGLVDWGSFGLTNPSLSLYQLADRPVWSRVKRRYKSMGGSIREDITYAASSIHLAWAPIYCKQRDLPLEKEYTQEYFEAMHAQFEARALS